MVMADSGSDFALDKGEIEASFEHLSARSSGVERREGEALIGERTIRRRGGTAAGASSTKKGRKSKREHRRERKEMTIRELERRTRANFEHGGSVAQGNKLIDDLNEVAIRPVRKSTPAEPRGP